METVRVQAGQTELIKNDRFIDSAHAGVTGLSAKVVIFRNTTPRFWDGSAYQTTPTDLAMTEIDATNLPGHYVYSLNTTGMTEEEHFVITKSGSTLNASVINDSQEGAIWIGGYIDNLDAAVSSRAAPGAAMDLVTDAVDSAALAATGLVEIEDAILNAGLNLHTVSGSIGEAIKVAGSQGVVTTVAVSPAPSTTQVSLVAGSNIDDFYNDMLYLDFTNKFARVVSDYVGATKTLIFDEPLPYAPTPGDSAVVRLDHIHSEENIADAVLDELMSGHNLAGTVGELLTSLFAGNEKNRKVLSNRVEVSGAGPYTIDVYEDNGTTIAFTLQVSSNFLSRTVI